MAGTNIIPGLRFDYLSESGSNFSPSLNLSELGEYVKVKAGIARAFKAPNLYQTSEGIYSIRKATVVQRYYVRRLLRSVIRTSILKLASIKRLGWNLP